MSERPQAQSDRETFSQRGRRARSRSRSTPPTLPRQLQIYNPAESEAQAAVNGPFHPERTNGFSFKAESTSHRETPTQPLPGAAHVGVAGQAIPTGIQQQSYPPSITPVNLYSTWDHQASFCQPTPLTSSAPGRRRVRATPG